MAVKIFIKRKVTDKNVLELTVLMKKLRALTLNQPGYIYGETLRRIDKTGEMLVISTWRSKADWEAWLQHSQRISLQSEVDMLLGEETTYEAYEE
ncbi:MAG: antibiotic biosynthesis monooxygenase [Deltaproteobacteria bacterium]|nr:MAG: antibiotic biosynthesis monooxygenase [Deltaproteobacteria bacterium]